MARIGSAAKLAWKKESVWGTYVTPDSYFRANTENLLPKYDLVDDDTLIGNMFKSNKWKVGESVEGNIEGPLFPNQTGMTMLSVLGAEAAVSDPVVAYLLISYNGAETYIRLTKSSNTLTAEKSSNGSSWSNDTAFNTSGTIDLSNASFDTLTELQAAIAGYTGYDCILFGAGATSSTTIVDFSATKLKTAGVNEGGYLMKATATSATDCKLHTITNAALTAELPSFSFIAERGLGTNQSLTFAGCNIKTLTLTNGAKDIVKSTLSVAGKVEATAVNDVSLTPSTVKPYRTADVKLVFEDTSGNLVEMDEIKTITVSFNPSLDDNRVLGSLYPKQPTRQGYQIQMSGQANNTSTQYAITTQYKAQTMVSAYLYVKSIDNANTTYSVPYSMFIRIPNYFLDDFTSPTANRDRYVINFAGTVMKSGSTVNTETITVLVTDMTTATY